MVNNNINYKYIFPISGIHITIQYMVALKIAGQENLARVQGIASFFGAIVSLGITALGGKSLEMLRELSYQNLSLPKKLEYQDMKT